MASRWLARRPRRRATATCLRSDWRAARNFIVTDIRINFDAFLRHCMSISASPQQLSPMNLALTLERRDRNPQHGRLLASKFVQMRDRSMTTASGAENGRVSRGGNGIKALPVVRTVSCQSAYASLYTLRRDVGDS